METTRNVMLWRVWVDTVNRIVSFHEAEGFRPIEFRSREMFLSCVDEYTGQHLSLIHIYVKSPCPKEAQRVSTVKIFRSGNSPFKSSAAMTED